MKGSLSLGPLRPYRLSPLQVSPTSPLPPLPPVYLLQPQPRFIAQTAVSPAPGKGLCGCYSLSLKVLGVLALPHPPGLRLNITPSKAGPDPCLSPWNATTRQVGPVCLIHSTPQV